MLAWLCSPALALFTHRCTCGMYSSCAFSHSHVKLPSTFQQRADPHTPSIISHSFMSKEKKTSSVLYVYWDTVRQFFQTHAQNLTVCMCVCVCTWLTDTCLPITRGLIAPIADALICANQILTIGVFPTHSRIGALIYICVRESLFHFCTQNIAKVLFCVLFMGSEAYPHTLLWLWCGIQAHRTSHSGKSRWCSHSAGIHTRPPRCLNTHSHLQEKFCSLFLVCWKFNTVQRFCVTHSQDSDLHKTYFTQIVFPKAK